VARYHGLHAYRSCDQSALVGSSHHGNDHFRHNALAIAYDNNFKNGCASSLRMRSSVHSFDSLSGSVRIKCRRHGRATTVHYKVAGMTRVSATSAGERSYHITTAPSTELRSIIGRVLAAVTGRSGISSTAMRAELRAARILVRLRRFHRWKCVRIMTRDGKTNTWDRVLTVLADDAARIGYE